jgi:hypothetical protein
MCKPIREKERQNEQFQRGPQEWYEEPFGPLHRIIAGALSAQNEKHRFMNDIVNYETRYFSTNEYAADLKNEFDQLYDEAATRRRMMSVSAHDRIAGRPSRTKILEDCIRYAQQHQGVVFMRKLEIARFALESPSVIREGRAAQRHATA